MWRWWGRLFASPSLGTSRRRRRRRRARRSCRDHRRVQGGDASSETKKEKEGKCHGLPDRWEEGRWEGVAQECATVSFPLNGAKMTRAFSDQGNGGLKSLQIPFEGSKRLVKILLKFVTVCVRESHIFNLAPVILEHIFP